MPAALTTAWCILILRVSVALGSRVSSRGAADGADAASAQIHTGAKDGADSFLGSSKHLAAAGHQSLNASAGQFLAERRQEHPREQGSQSEVAHASVRRLIQSLVQNSGGSETDKCWLLDGDRTGCKADCKCGILEQCYPKFISVVDTGNSGHLVENIGICGTAMPLLVFLSTVLFVFSLACVILARMYLQWREAVLAESAESMDKPKGLLLPSSTTPALKAENAAG